MGEEWVEMEFIKAEAEGRLIHLFARDAKTKKKYHYIVYDFYPYYYTKGEPPEDGDVLWTEKGYRSLFGDNLTKVVVSHPGVVPKLRRSGDFEADVMYTHRFLIDMEIGKRFFVKKSKLKHKKLSILDIRGCWYEDIGLRH